MYKWYLIALVWKSFLTSNLMPRDPYSIANSSMERAMLCWSMDPYDHIQSLALNRLSNVLGKNDELSASHMGGKEESSNNLT